MDGLTPDQKEMAERKLAPKHGEIPVGGAHMDPFFAGDAMWEFLRLHTSLRDVADAWSGSIHYSIESIKKWNSQHAKDYVIHRDPWSQEARIKECAFRLIAARHECHPSEVTRSVVGGTLQWRVKGEPV